MKALSLEEHVRSKEKKQTYVNWLFETIAPRYDLVTVLLSGGMDKRWKRKLIDLASISGRETILDLACGTGDITFGIASHLGSGTVIGLDITARMITIAEQKRRCTEVENVAFSRGDIMGLPYSEQQFDVVTAGYALRNVPDIEAALIEIKRVLKPGGLFLSLEFGHPPGRFYHSLYLGYLTIIGAALGLVLHGNPDTYRYIPETVKFYPGQEGVRGIMERLGFTRTGFHNFGGGIMAINYGRK